MNSLYEDPPETAKAGAIWHFAGVGYSHFRSDWEIEAHLVSFRNSFTGTSGLFFTVFPKNENHTTREKIPRTRARICSGLVPRMVGCFLNPKDVATVLPTSPQILMVGQNQLTNRRPNVYCLRLSGERQDHWRMGPRATSTCYQVRTKQVSDPHGRAFFKPRLDIVKFLLL